MTPPNITKGEWKLCEETIDGWGGDEVSFSIRDENNELIVCLDMDQRYARFLSASKAMAEALHGAYIHLHGIRSCFREDTVGHNEIGQTMEDMKRALLQAGYTE